MLDSEPQSSSAPLICVVGPTAVGKTALTVELALRFGGEVVNADSRQVYRGMSIGTAKPTESERKEARHHLVDIIDPPESFGLGLFLEHAHAALQDIRARGRLPIVCGGTGQYVWALVEGQSLHAAPPDAEFRAAMEAEAEMQGAEAMHARLTEIDPVRAAALDSRNVRRVIRALEIYHVTGRLPSEVSPASMGSGDALVLGLTMARDALYQRIDERVDRMMADGFLAEVAQLLSAGYPRGTGPLASPGYRELGHHLAGELSLEEAVRRTKTQTHRLARRQYAWFKLADPRIRWLDAGDSGLNQRAAEAVTAYLSRGTPVLE